MKSMLVCLVVIVIISAVSGCTSNSIAPNEPIQAVTYTNVRITDSFWSPRLQANRKVSVPQMLNEYERQAQTPNMKLVEAVGHILAQNPDPQLEANLNSKIDSIINTFKSQNPNEKWIHLKNGEMYVAGHFFEAAVAYHNATGNQNILNAAVELANHLESVFGPGKRYDVSGHEEVKIGLLKLYKYTGDKKYYELAKFFIDQRGKAINGRQLYGQYAQDHKPVVEQVFHIRLTFVKLKLCD